MNIPVDTEAMISNLPISIESLPEFLIPSGAKAMLRRASHNILYAIQQNMTMEFGYRQPAMFAAFTAHFLLQTGLPLILIEGLRGLTTLDCSAFILNKLSPMVPQPYRGLLEESCEPIITEEAIAVGIRRTRRNATVQVRYFVGMVLEHAQYGYLGCITGWDVSIHFRCE